MLRTTLTVVALSAIFLALAAPARAHGAGGHDTCRIGTLRVTGKNSLFALACRCGESLEFLGRASRFLDADTPDTIAQERVTVNCIERKKPAMEVACERSGDDFEYLADRVLQECMAKRPRNPSPRGMRPFRFRKNMCASEFRELDANRAETLLVCACTQRPGYIVHPGVVQFVTEGSPNGAGEEQELLRECTSEVLPTLDQACKLMPTRFDLRSAQMFNVCCKRARSMFPDDKLKCQATVPDDVTDLSLTFV